MSGQHSKCIRRFSASVLGSRILRFSLATSSNRNNYSLSIIFIDKIHIKHRIMNFGGQNDGTSPNKDEAKHGRHDAHKHHDTMGEIVQAQGQGLSENVKNKHVDSVDNQVKEVNPHSESLGTYQIDKYGNCVERDLKYHHSST